MPSNRSNKQGGDHDDHDHHREQERDDEHSGPRQENVEIAKNYLSAEELNVLNRIVTAYPEFAEVQALNQTPMYMRDWMAKLDDFLKLSGRALLEHAGKISHDQAIERARFEYDKFRRQADLQLSPVEQHFFESVKKLKTLPSQAKPRKKKS